MRRPWERRRRWLRWGLGGLLALLLLSAAGLYLFYPRIGAWAIRSKVIAKLEARLDRGVAVGAIEVNRDGLAVLHDVVVRGANDGATPLIRIDKVTVTYDFWASATGDVRIDTVTIAGLHGSAVRTADGRDNFSDVLRRITTGRRDESSQNAAVSAPSRMRPKKFVVISGDGVFRDEGAGVELSVGQLTVEAEPDLLMRAVVGEIAARTSVGPAASIQQVVVTAEMNDLRSSAQAQVSGGRASLWPGMSLTGIDGTLSEGDKHGVVELDLSGGYGGAAGTLWNAEGWLDPRNKTGSIAMRADRFTLGRIAPVIEGSAVRDFKYTSVDAQLQIDVSPGRADIAGDFHIAGLTIYHRMLAEEPLRNLELSGPIALSYHRRSRRLELIQADLSSRGVLYKLTGFAAMPGGFEMVATAATSSEPAESAGAAAIERRRPQWHVGGRFIVPTVPCQKMLDGIPKALLPHIAGAKMRGKFYTDLSVDIDFADLDATQLSGSVGIRGCKVKKMVEETDAKRLLEPFTHTVELAKDQWMSFEIGPENPDFVPIQEVSPLLIKSLMTTEDSRFYRHKGFIVSEFRTALIKDLKAGYFKYGASSITMQMVKNVMLHRQKTLSRKLQELFLTWYIEGELDKDRIMEIYLNAIEYGPALYGIGPATNRYFGKHPSDLNPVEAAFFSSILPNPKKRYLQYCSGELWRKTAAKIQRILKIMRKRDRLTEDEYLVAKDTPLVFYRYDALPERECKKKVKEAIVSARSTRAVDKDALAIEGAAADTDRKTERKNKKSKR